MPRTTKAQCLSKGACLQCVSRGASVQEKHLSAYHACRKEHAYNAYREEHLSAYSVSKGACLQCVSRGASARLEDSCLFSKSSTCHSPGLFIDFMFSDFQQHFWKKAIRGDTMQAMIPPKKPQIAQSRLDPSDPERERMARGQLGRLLWRPSWPSSPWPRCHQNSLHREKNSYCHYFQDEHNRSIITYKR